MLLEKLVALIFQDVFISFKNLFFLTFFFFFCKGVKKIKQSREFMPFNEAVDNVNY